MAADNFPALLIYCEFAVLVNDDMQEPRLNHVPTNY